MCRFVVLLCLALLQVFVITTYASAAFIQIIGKSDIQVEWDGKQGRLIGTYILSNQGDDMASYVYPSLTLGRSVWIGDRKILQPKSSKKWSFEMEFSSIDLVLPFEQSRDLVMAGKFPVLVSYRYEDRNGREFSAADVITVSIESHDSLKQDIATWLDCVPKSDIWECRLRIRNSSKEARQIYIAYHLPRELEVEEELIQVDKSIVNIAPGQEVKHVEIIGNRSGLEGSSYAVFAIVRWKVSGNQHVGVSTSSVQIRRQSKTTSYLILTALSMLIGLWVISRSVGIDRKK